MKIKFFISILFLFTALESFAQREIKREAMYVEIVNGQKFIVSFREYLDGTIISRLPGNFYRLPVTDTVQIVNFFASQFIGSADEYSSQIVSTPKLGQTNSTLTAFDSTLTQLFPVFNLRNMVRDLYKPEMLTFKDSVRTYNWTLVTGQVAQEVEFIEAGAQKVLRLKLANGTLLPVVVNSGRWFRVLNLDGANREFHRVENPENPAQVIFAVFNENGQQIYRLRRTNA